jgi:hypothetical protein
MDYCTQ